MLIVLGALAGLTGVALAAAAAHHSGGAHLETASRFLMLHAPVLLALAALTGTGAVHPGLGRIAGWVVVLGLVLFCGDLAMRAFRGSALFPMAAPTGGFVLMAGWGLIAVAALLRVFR
jgi:uncharacterized membrane protein YgdD (TMEM256/DUF423 family)